MTTNKSSGSAFTAPKGQATRARADGSGGTRRMSSTMQWTLVIILGLIVMAAIFYFGRNVQSTVHSGAPAAVEVVAVDPLA